MIQRLIQVLTTLERYSSVFDVIRHTSNHLEQQIQRLASTVVDYRKDHEALEKTVTERLDRLDQYQMR